MCESSEQRYIRKMVTAVSDEQGFAMFARTKSLPTGKFARFNRKQLLNVTVAATTLEFVPT